MVSGGPPRSKDSQPPIDSLSAKERTTTCPLTTVLDESVEESLRYGFGAGMDLQFFIDAADVEINRVDRDA